MGKGSAKVRRGKEWVWSGCVEAAIFCCFVEGIEKAVVVGEFGLKLICCSGRIV